MQDFETDEQNIQLFFTLNGIKQEIAFEIPKESLEGKALFPHVLSKNISFEVNFGDRFESFTTSENFEDDFEWAAKVPQERRVKGPSKPEEKNKCEVYFIVYEIIDIFPFVETKIIMIIFCYS